MTKQQASYEYRHVDAIDTIVAIPTLNESAHIESVLHSLQQQGVAAGRVELWVVDGGSADGTVEAVERMSAHHSNVKLLHNPGRTQASAVNLAAVEANSVGGIRYLVRADAHAGYPAGWVSMLIETAEKEGADSVVVPMRTCGGSEMRDASSDLFNSWLGNGGAPHRTGETRGFVKHGHHALFRLDAFIEAGGYDPDFLANEDAELDVRLDKLGRRIFLENRAMIDYYPRNRLDGVCRQFFRNGRFRLCTSLKHGAGLQLRQLAPIGLSAGLVGSVALGAAIHPAFLVPAAAYVALIFASAFLVATKKSWRRIKLIAVTAMAAHVAFGFGAIVTAASYLRERLRLLIRPDVEAEAESR